MSLIKVRKIATLDSEAKDIQLPFVITFNNGKKEFREGYSEEEVRRRFDKSIAALYGGIKSVKLEGEDKRDGKDSIAADAKFKIGDKVKHAKVKFPVQPIGKISEVYDDPRWVEVEWENMPYKYQTIETSNLLPANSRATDASGTDANFKVGDTVRVDASYSRNVNNGIGKVVKVDGSSDIVVEFAGHGTVRVPVSYATLVNSHATDYDPNPQTRGKDIEVFSAQAIREESACENVLRKVIEDVEALVIKIHGPMSSWEEVIENSEMSPELPQAKKWSATANRRYDYLLARERAISSILSELKRNHID